MRATKLPSGAYRYLVPYYDSEGKRKYKSFSDRDRLTAKSAAEKFKAEHRPVPAGSFGAMMDAYITRRTALLSPSTIRGYRNIQKRIKTSSRGLYEASGASITGSQVQDFLNSLGESPKTIRNYCGLIHAVLRENDISIGRITLPQKQARTITVPEEKRVREIIQQAKGTELELPIMLAAFGGLRRGEVCALEMSDIDFKKKTIHVCKDIVPGPDGKYHVKPPKTPASDRYIDMTGLEDVLKIIKENGKITDLSPSALSLRFRRLVNCEFRYHDLRHFCASYMHSLGIPDSYIQKRCGWENDTILKAVYRHTLQDQNREFTRKANESFRSFVTQS